MTLPLNKFARQRGVALVLTLAILGLVTLLVMGFAISMRTEQMAAKTYNQTILSRQLADGAVDEAIFLIRKTTPVITAANSYVTQPGYGVSTTGGTTPLFSNYGSGGTYDLNYDRSIIASNNVYNTTTTDDITVNWITLATNGQASIVGTVTNAIIGRYAYWVDDEAAKINISSAAVRTNVVGSTMRDVDLTVLSGIGSATAMNSLTYANGTGFFTTEQWKLTSGIGAATYEQNKFYLTAHSNGLGFTPWGKPKFNLNSDFATWQAEVDSGGVNTLNNSGLSSWFGTTFKTKYFDTTAPNEHILKQTLANMADFQFAAGGGAVACMGGAAGYLNSGGGLGRTGIPIYYLGLRRYPYLNEIGVQATYWRPNTHELQCKLWFLVEVVNPYDQPWGSGGQIRINLDKLVYRVTDSLGLWNYFCGYETGWIQNPACVVLNPPYASPQEVFYNITANIAANTSTVFPVAVWSGNTESNVTALIDQVYVRVNKVRLLQTQADDTTIRDWASIDDFDKRLLGGNHFTFLGATIRYDAAGDFAVGYNNANTKGIAKNDPRVRRFTFWTPPGDNTARIQPWTPVDFDVTVSTYPSTIPNAGGAQNSTVNMSVGTGLTGINNDPLPASSGFPAATNVVTSPSFYLKTANSNIPYDSIGELGYIHTGLQWRTLMLQPRPTAEAVLNYVPDWAVLDIFSVTNAAVMGRININAAVTNLYSTNASWKRRVEPLRAITTAITAANAMGDSTDGNRIASNIYNRAFATSGANGWPTKRVTAPFNFTPGMYDMIGELCEVDLISTNWAPSTAYTNDFVRENRIRSFANLVTTRSEQFTVWAIGQAVQDVNNNGVYDAGDFIAGETKVRAVVSRIQGQGADNLWGTNDDTLEYRCLEFKNVSN